MEKIKIGIIFGGKSAEHEVSLMSATSVIRAINKEKYDIVKIGITKTGKWLLFDGDEKYIEDGSWQQMAESFLRENPDKYALTIMGNEKSLKDIIDFAFPVLHGPDGEDGTIQGLFEMLDIPYAGCGVLGSAVAMDKAVAKELFTKAGLPSCKYMLIHSDELANDKEQAMDKAEKELQYPIFVKPANMGSSVGMTKAHNKEELAAGMIEAAKYDRRLILEETVVGREVETGVIGNYDLRVVSVGEVIASHEFYDYEAKYRDDMGTAILIPANITAEEKKEMQELALRAYRALDCQGFARVDCFIEKSTGKVLINEINTIPGFTRYSMFPLLAADDGLAYVDLITKIIDLGFERQKLKK